MIDNKLGLLGICAKAGKVASGGFMTEEAIIKGKAYFVLITEDASDNTKKKFINKCDFYGIPYVVYGTQNIIGHMIGKGDRTCLAIVDEGFGKQFVKKFGIKDQEV
ncbi:MAG: ribosomal L7Ae/L30e/S12e/Gadd45 family protein [Eubacterium sp.]|nr:ribosomal L7Ae/L30e/S12e/Gadd45 family protein [Eubacterium sp.]